MRKTFREPVIIEIPAIHKMISDLSTGAWGKVRKTLIEVKLNDSGMHKKYNSTAELESNRRELIRNVRHMKIHMAFGKSNPAIEVKFGKGSDGVELTVSREEYSEDIAHIVQDNLERMQQVSEGQLGLAVVLPAGFIVAAAYLGLPVGYRFIFSLTIAVMAVPILGLYSRPKNFFLFGNKLVELSLLARRCNRLLIVFCVASVFATFYLPSWLMRLPQLGESVTDTAERVRLSKPQLWEKLQEQFSLLEEAIKSSTEVLKLKHFGLLPL